MSAIADDWDEVGTGTERPPGLHLPSVGRGQALAFAAVATALGWAYWPNLASLYRTWVREPDYSHGFLVVPLALAILWRRWPGSGSTESGSTEGPARGWLASSGFGWGLAGAALAARAVFLERGQSWLESATLLPLLVGLGLAGLGWRTMLRVWPAFAFLVFLFPLPPQINSSLSQPLQSLATKFSCDVLKMTGLWVMPEGNVILVGKERLEVAAACNGLSMLMSLAAVVAAAASLISMSNWKRVLLLVSIIPIALMSNVLRIAATAWCFHAFGADLGSKYAHDAAGWLMMPVAMILVGLELTIASWLIVESEVDLRAVERQNLAFVTGGKPSDRPLKGGNRP